MVCLHWYFVLHSGISIHLEWRTFDIHPNQDVVELLGGVIPSTTPLMVLHGKRFRTERAACWNREGELHSVDTVYSSQISLVRWAMHIDLKWWGGDLYVFVMDVVVSFVFCTCIPGSTNGLRRCCWASTYCELSVQWWWMTEPWCNHLVYHVRNILREAIKLYKIWSFFKRCTKHCIWKNCT